MVDFKDFQNHYLNNILPKLENDLDQSLSGENSLKDILDFVTGSYFGTDIVILAEYHKWLTENFNIIPKA